MNKRTKSGFTLIEMLVAIAVIVLLIIGIGAGVNAGLKAYKESIFESNCGTLSEILNTTIGDALRYSEDVSGENSSFTFTNYDYNVKACYFTIKDIDNRSGGYVYMTNGVTGEKAINVPIVNDGAYADDLMVTSLVITSHKSDNGGYYFDIAYTITSISDSSLSHDYTLRVRQANADVQYVIDINSGSDTPGGSEGGGGDSPTVDAESITIVYDSNVPTDVNDRFVFTDVFGNKTRSVTQVMDPKVSTTFRTFSADKASCSWYELTSWKDDAGHVYLPGSDATLEEAEITRINSQEGGTLTLYAQWSPATYTIIYDNNGGSGSKTQTFTKADKTVTLYSNNSSVYDEKITNSGHEVTFIGNSGTVEGKDTHKITAQCELLKWTAGGTEYSLGQTLTIADGFITGFDPKVKEITLSAKWSSAKVTLPTPEKKSWSFRGWTTAKFAQKGTAAGTVVEVSADTTYYAQWRRTISFRNNFNDDDKTTYYQTYYYYGGTDVSIPDGTPTREGYTFEGWYTSKEYKTKVTSSNLMKRINEKNNGTYYAKWEPIKYEIVYNANPQSNGKCNTSGSTASTKCVYDENSTIASNGFTYTYTLRFKDNGTEISDSPVYVPRTFKCWNTKADGSGTDYNPGDSVKNLTLDNSITLYAIWNAASNYTALPSYTHNTWQFKGWGKFASAKASDAVSGIKLTSHADLHAILSRTVTYDAGGKVTDPSPATYYITEAAPSLATVTEPTEYGFSGWFTSASGGTQVTDLSKATFSSDGKLTLYAHWGPKYKINVTFAKGDGGDTIHPASGTVFNAPTTHTQDWSGSSYVEFTYDIPTRVGYTFNGWEITSNSSNAAVTQSLKSLNTKTYVKVTGIGGKEVSVTLKAKWNAESYTVTLDGNGGTLISGKSKTISYNYSSTASIPTDQFEKRAKVTLNANGGSVSPTTMYSSCTLTGWNTAANGSGKAYTSLSQLAADSKGNITLYAQWSSSALSSNLPTPTRANWSFVNWKLKNGTTTYNTSTKYSFTADTELVAQWKCTITFDANGGKFTDGSTTKTVTYNYGGSNISVPSTSPTLTGNNFTGWFTGTSGGYQKTNSNITDYAKETGSTTLYANWDAKTVKVYYNGNGSNGGSVNPVDVKYGSNFTTASADAFTRIYYMHYYYTIGAGSTQKELTGLESRYARSKWLIEGWTLNGTSGTTYGTSTSVSINTLSPNAENITLYAKWKHNSGAITYAQRDNTAFKTWYLDGWSSTAGATSPNKDSSGNTMTWEVVTSDHNYYAVLSRTVTFNGNGGTPSKTSDKYYSTQNAPTITATATRPGYEFAGWYTTSSYSGSPVTNMDSAIYNDTGSATLYAKWTPTYDYTVTFDTNLGTVTKFAATNMPSGTSGTYKSKSATYVQSLKDPTREGFTFAGWDVYVNGSKTTTLAKGTSSYTIAGSSGANTTVKFVAKWNQIMLELKISNRCVVKVSFKLSYLKPDDNASWVTENVEIKWKWDDSPFKTYLPYGTELYYYDRNFSWDTNDGITAYEHFTLKSAMHLKIETI